MILAQMFRKLSFIGCPQYYLFQGRPTAGNLPYTVPLVQGYFLFEEAKKHVSGLAKRARFVMSHESGKIEIVGVDASSIYLRYHRAKDPENEGRFMVFRRDDNALWLDELLSSSGEAFQNTEGRLAAQAEYRSESLQVIGPGPD
jgi:L-lysine 2,3-aminomutase